MVDDPSFWTLVAFLLFLMLVAKPFRRHALPALDNHIKKVEQDIERASQAYVEAQTLLMQAREAQGKAKHLAQEILQHSQQEAERLRQEAQEEIKRFLSKEEQLMLDRIHRAEQAALKEVRRRSFKVALQAAEKLLESSINSTHHQELTRLATQTLEHMTVTSARQ
ncbi:MAG: hypothetical protein ACK5O7_02895 [Holosporales bacterium]